MKTRIAKTAARRKSKPSRCPRCSRRKGCNQIVCRKCLDAIFQETKS